MLWLPGMEVVKAQIKNMCEAGTECVECCESVAPNKYLFPTRGNV